MNFLDQGIGSLKKFRNDLQLSQKDLALLLNVTQATVARWEQGQSLPKDVSETLGKILIICDDNFLKQWFLTMLRGSGGFLTCEIILSLCEMDMSKEKQTAKDILIKEQTAHSVYGFLKEYFDHEGKLKSNELYDHVKTLKTETLKNKRNAGRGSMRLSTRGFKEISFDFSYDRPILTIRNEKNRHDLFPLSRIVEILDSLYAQFELEFFPLANNVQLLGSGDERPGFGRTIYDLNGRDTKNAQAASYLGPLLESIGILKWNGIRKGIEWHLLNPPPPTIDELEELLIGQQ